MKNECHFGGIIGALNSNTTISNCSTNLDINISAIKDCYIGGIVGYDFSTAVTLEECSSTLKCTVGGEAETINIGGLCRNAGNINNCNAKTEIIVNENVTASVGGLTCFANTITNSNAILKTTSSTTPYIESIGGLAGSACMVEKCYAKVDLKTNCGAHYIGGLLGQSNNRNESGTLNWGYVRESYATGQMEFNTATYAGGLIGYARRNAISNVYSDVDIVGAYVSNCGELCYFNGGSNAYGWPLPTVTNSYSTGKIDLNGSEWIGFAPGCRAEDVTNSYYIPELLNKEKENYRGFEEAGQERTLEQIKKANNYENWDFSNTWKIAENVTLPYLLNNREDAVKVRDIQAKLNTQEEESQEQLTTVPEGYIGIYNQTDLANIKNDLRAKYILMKDITISGNFETIGQRSTQKFSGILDGNYHKISNLKIESDNLEVGMFGGLYGATVKNLELKNVNIMGTKTNQLWVGGLTGASWGSKIYGVTVTGKITADIMESTGTINIGGLIGTESYGTIVENCYCEVDLSGEYIGTAKLNYIGGISGNGGIVKKSSSKVEFSNQDISDIDYFGGIVGSDPKKIEECSSIVKINLENNEFKAHSLGGIVGSASSENSKIDACNATIEISAKTMPDYIGGIAGNFARNYN